MIWLLDVSFLAAYLSDSHEHHERAVVWGKTRRLAVCPITELGFLRTACAIGFNMSDARKVLSIFLDKETPLFVPCDRRALDCPPVDFPRKTTDIYLADLAAAHGMRFATLDTRIDHPAVDLIPDVKSSTAW